jgi:ribosomal protein S18 acetylase RimI-like enzyme
MGASIRPARVDEIDDVLDLWRRAEAESSATDDPDGVAALIARDPGALLLAEEDGELIGSLIAAWDGWRAGMYRLAVVPEHRRRGVARMLVEAGERRLRELGARRVGAFVISQHDHAVGFWLDAGYELDPRIGRFVKNLR